MPTSVTSTKLAEAALSCLVLRLGSRSLGVCHLLMEPGTGFGADLRCQHRGRTPPPPTYISPVSRYNHFSGTLLPVATFGSVC